MNNSSNSTKPGEQLYIGGRKVHLAEKLLIKIPVTTQVINTLETPDIMQMPSSTAMPIVLLMMLKRMTAKINKETGSQEEVANWVPPNETGEHLLAQALSSADLGRCLNMVEMQSIAAVGPSELEALNDFLSKNNRPIFSEKIENTDVVATAIMDIVLKWNKPGRDTTIQLQNGKMVAGFEIDLAHNGEYFESPDPNTTRCVCLNTSTSTRQVWISPIDRPLPTEDLIAYVEDLEYRSTLKMPMMDAFIPEIDLNIPWDLSPLIWSILGTQSIPYVLKSIIASAQLKMDKNGATARADVTGRSVMLCRRTKTVIDGPFVVWIKDTRCSEPMIVFMVGVDSMKPINS